MEKTRWNERRIESIFYQRAMISTRSQRDLWRWNRIVTKQTSFPVSLLQVRKMRANTIYDSRTKWPEVEKRKRKMKSRVILHRSYTIPAHIVHLNVLKMMKVMRKTKAPVALNADCRPMQKVDVDVKQKDRFVSDDLINLYSMVLWHRRPTRVTSYLIFCRCRNQPKCQL